MADEPATPTVLVAGDAVVDVYPEGADRFAVGGSMTLQPGGTAANVALTVAALADPPHLCTRFAADAFGRLLRAHATDAGVPETCFQEQGDRTTVAFLPDVTPPLAWHTYLEPDSLGFTASEVPASVLDAVEWVHLTGITVGDPDNRAETLALARRARDADCTVSFDLNGRANQWDSPADYRRALDELLPSVDVAFASRDDVALAGVDLAETDAADDEAALDAARWVHDRGPETVFVTRGERGAVASRRTGDGESHASHAGFEVHVVNTAGAGDAFVGGVAAAVQRGVPLDDLDALLRIGNAAGAAATTEATTTPTAARVTDLVDGDALFGSR